MMSPDHLDHLDHPDWLPAARRLLGDDTAVRRNLRPGDPLSVLAGTTPAIVRLWELPATVERVTALRALHLALPETAEWVPRPFGAPDAVTRHDGRPLDACIALPGLPLFRHGRFRVGEHGTVDLPLHDTADHGEVMVLAGAALGQLHEATRDHAALRALPVVTVEGVLRVVTDAWQRRRRRLGAQAASLPEVRRWLRCGNRIIPVATERIAESPDIARVRNVLIHGDVWPSALRVDEPARPKALLGITGWEHAAAGSPVLDLAQLSVRVSGWSEAAVESVLGAYSDHAALPPAARRLVPVVAALDLLHQVGRLLEIAWLDDAVADDPAQPFIRGGAKSLLRSLERLTHVLAPDEEPPRLWRRGLKRDARGAGGMRRPPSRNDAPTGTGARSSRAARPPRPDRSPPPSPRGRRRGG